MLILLEDVIVSLDGCSSPSALDLQLILSDMFIPLAALANAVVTGRPSQP